MDIDQYIARNEASWTELESLTKRAGRTPRRLNEDELDRFVRLYQSTSTQLSHVRTVYRDIPVTMRLTRLVANANGILYGKQSRTWSAFGDFFMVTFPAAVWSARRFVAISAALTFVPAIVIALWLNFSDAAVAATASDAAREAYIQEDFEAYYSSSPAAEFSTQVLVNNIQVSFLAFAGGVFLSFGTAVILVFNGANVGVAAGLFHSVGEAPRFYGLILPHGLLELSAIVIAGAAGLRLGWSIIAPGDLTRGASLAREGRRSVVIVLGLILVFIVAGLIEGFVTPSGLSTPLRVGIGVVVELAFVTYLIAQGRAAARAGMKGLWGENP